MLPPIHVSEVANATPGTASPTSVEGVSTRRQAFSLLFSLVLSFRRARVQRYGCCQPLTQLPDRIVFRSEQQERLWRGNHVLPRPRVRRRRRVFQQFHSTLVSGSVSRCLIHPKQKSRHETRRAGGRMTNAVNDALCIAMLSLDANQH